MSLDHDRYPDERSLYDRDQADRDQADRDYDDRGPDDDVLDAGGIPAIFADRARLAAIWTGFGAAALGCFVAVVVALAMWVPDAAATGTSGSTVRGGLLAFLAAQHGGLRINSTAIGFVPLGMTAFAVYLARRSGQVLWLLPSVGEASRRRVLELLTWQVAAYTTTTVAVSFYAVVGHSSAAPVAVGLGSIGVGLAGFGSVAAMATPIGEQLWTRLSGPVRTAVRAGLGSAAALIAAGALLALGSTILRFGRFLSLSRGMGRGLSGLPIAVGDLLAAPNAVLAGTSYLAGPGFAVGHHATYAPFGAHGGLVPAFPVLAGLPVGEHASLTVLALMLLTVGGAGVAAGLIVHRELRADRWKNALLAALGAAVTAGLVVGALAALAGGSLGASQLSAVGASPGRVGLAVLVEVGAGSLITVVAARWLTRGSSAAGAVTSAPTARLTTVGPSAPTRRLVSIDGDLTRDSTSVATVEETGDRAEEADHADDASDDESDGLAAHAS